MPRTYLTPGGQARLRRRIEAARARYQAVVADNPDALESGDTSGWHDNFAFEENQRQMHQLARQVRELETLLAQATVVPLPRRMERVILGAGVRWRFVDEARESTCWISGFDDGDPLTGRMSYNSPLGAAMLSAEIGEERSLRISGQPRTLEILDLFPIDPAQDTSPEPSPQDAPRAPEADDVLI